MSANFPIRKPSLFSLRGLPLVALSVLALVSAACGRTTKIYSDPAAPQIATITGNMKNPLPAGYFDHSVNQGMVDITLDGTTATSLAIRLQIKAGTNAAGGFNGSGTGNRALLGQGTHSGKKLVDLANFSFDAKSVNGADALSLLLLVDLDCSGATSRVFSAAAADLAPGTSQASGYTRYSADTNEAKWHVSGAAIKDPSDNAITLVPSSGAAASLSAFLAKYPNACIFNGVNSDDGLPKTTPTAGVLLSLGSSTSIVLSTLFVNRIAIGTDVYEGLEWGSL
jgi:hypothetical protein